MLFWSLVLLSGRRSIGVEEKLLRLPLGKREEGRFLGEGSTGGVIRVKVPQPGDGVVMKGTLRFGDIKS